MSQKTALYQLTRKSRKKNITSHNQNDHLGKVNNRLTNCRTKLSTLDSDISKSSRGMPKVNNTRLA